MGVPNLFHKKICDLWDRFLSLSPLDCAFLKCNWNKMKNVNKFHLRNKISDMNIVVGAALINGKVPCSSRPENKNYKHNLTQLKKHFSLL